MIGARSLVIALLTLTFGIASAQTTDVRYDVSAGVFYCKGSQATEVCSPKLHLNDTIRLYICGAPVDLIAATETQRELPGYSVTKETSQKFGIVEQKAASGYRLPPADAKAEDDETVARLFNALRLAVDRVLDDLRRTSSFSAYQEHHPRLRAAFEDLLLAVPTNMPNVLITRLQKQEVLNRIGMSAADVATFVQRVNGLAEASGRLDCYAPETFEAEAPFNVEVSWKAMNELISPPPNYVIPFRFRAWQVRTMAGFAASGLIDDHYTSRQETTGSGTDAVTVKKAVREARDQAATEVTLFMHVGPPSISAGMPRFLTLGGGLSTNNTSGRLYAGASWALGNTAAVTLGAAGGKVKRLSNNVPRQNLGDIDPEASRRDVFRVSWFVGLSWRVSGN